MCLTRKCQNRWDKKQKLTELQEKINESSIIVGDTIQKWTDSAVKKSVRTYLNSITGIQ